MITSNNLETAINLKCTPAAFEHIQKKLSLQSHHVGLRIRMKKRGCSGWSYIFEYGRSPQSDEVEYTTQEGLIVFVEREHRRFFQGAIIDYVQSGFNKSLTCISPNEGIRCGCGESFTVVE